MTSHPPTGESLRLAQTPSTPPTGDETSSPQIRSVLAAADRLESAGRWREAIDTLTHANYQARDATIERRLVRLRHDAFERLDMDRPPRWPPKVDASRPPGSPPEISARDVDSQVLISSILGAGSLLVRGLLPPSAVSHLVQGIDCAFAGRHLAESGQQERGARRWFDQFQPAPRYERAIPRGFLRNIVLAADSPALLFDLLEIIGHAGVPDLVAGHLREPPALSVTKTSLRRVNKDSAGQWHQDGAFMGTNIRTVNVWLALSHCGDDAPGLDILPCRLDDIVETGTPGAMFDWSASPAMVQEAGQGTAVCRPIFEPGDALLFDHMFMHRTAVSPEMTNDRYAVEMWFFAPSLYPQDQVPLVL